MGFLLSLRSTGKGGHRDALKGSGFPAAARLWPLKPVFFIVTRGVSTAGAQDLWLSLLSLKHPNASRCQIPPNHLLLDGNDEHTQKSRFLSPREKAEDCREAGNRDSKGHNLHYTESVQNLQRWSAECHRLRTQKEVPTHCHSKMPFCHA